MLLFGFFFLKETMAVFQCVNCLCQIQIHICTTTTKTCRLLETNMMFKTPDQITVIKYVYIFFCINFVNICSNLSSYVRYEQFVCAILRCVSKHVHWSICNAQKAFLSFLKFQWLYFWCHILCTLTSTFAFCCNTLSR